MTKKHFIELADTLKEIRQDFHEESLYGQLGVEAAMEIVQKRLNKFCRSQNSRFNEERFEGYVKGECGPSGGRVK